MTKSFDVEAEAHDVDPDDDDVAERLRTATVHADEPVSMKILSGVHWRYLSENVIHSCGMTP